MMLSHDVVEQVSLARTRGSLGVVAHGRRESSRPALNKHLAVVLCAVMSSLPIPAETQERIEIEAALHTWDGQRVPRELHAFRSAAEVEQAVACVLSEAGGLRSDNFDLQAADVPNAAAAVWPAGCGSGTQPCDRMLLYNPQFMRDIRDRTGNGWSGIAILAHEIGHHLEAHTISARGSNPTDELEADEFAGWVLRRLGATPGRSTGCIPNLSSRRELHASSEGWPVSRQWRRDGIGRAARAIPVVILRLKPISPWIRNRPRALQTG